MTLSREILVRRVAKQRLWIEQHGADRLGYVARYGSARDPIHYGEGGEAIYEADRADLLDRERELAARPI